jgi:RND family efflux transporter MFP subunit
MNGLPGGVYTNSAWNARYYCWAMLSASLALFVAGLGAGCRRQSAATEREVFQAVARDDAVPVTVAAVIGQPLDRTVSVIGTLYGFEEITVTPKVEGKVVALHCDVGDRVAPGALLLEIDPTDYQLAVREAERALEAELAQLGLTELPGPDFDIEQLPAIESARLVRDNAARRFQREKELFARNAGVLEHYEQAETDLKVAETQLRQARLNAQAILAAVRHRQAVLDVARQRLSDTRVYAPGVDGNPQTTAPPFSWVVTQRLLSVGEMVRSFPSTPAFVLMRDDVLKLRVWVPERYLAQVKTGADVVVTSDAYPDDSFPAKVVRIYPTVDPKNRSFEVEAHVANPAYRLRPGGFAKAQVIVSRSEQATIIPLAAVVQAAGVTKVFVVDNDKARQVPIRLGVQGAGWVEALGDLRPGDLVVTSGQSRLVDGSTVRVRQEPAQAEPQRAQQAATLRQRSVARQGAADVPEPN